MEKLPVPRYDIRVYAGQTFRLKLRRKDPITGLYINIAGANIRMQVRATRESTSSVLDLSTTLGTITITDAVNGEFEMLASAVIALLPGQYIFDIFMALTDEDPIMAGRFIVIMPATQDVI